MFRALTAAALLATIATPALAQGDPRLVTREYAPDRVVRSVCPYCAVGCQVDLHVRDGRLARVTSPWIEEATPNQGSTCVKGRFGYDFPQIGVKMQIVSKIFLRLIKTIIAPLLFATLVVGIAGHSNL